MTPENKHVEIGKMGNGEILYASRLPCYIPESIQNIAREEASAKERLLRTMRTYREVRLMGEPWDKVLHQEKRVGLVPLLVLPQVILSQLTPNAAYGLHQEIEINLGLPIGFQLWVEVQSYHRLAEYHLGTAQKYSKGRELFVLNERPIQTSWLTVTLLCNKLGMWTLVRVSMGKIAPKGTRKNPVRIAFTLQMPHVRVRHKKHTPKQKRR